MMSRRVGQELDFANASTVLKTFQDTYDLLIRLELSQGLASQRTNFCICRKLNIIGSGSQDRLKLLSKLVNVFEARGLIIRNYS